MQHLPAEFEQNGDIRTEHASVTKSEQHAEAKPIIHVPNVSACTRCVGGLRLIQEFLGMPKDLFRTEAALPPTVRDQKHAELMLYRLLNQVDSPVAKVKVRGWER